MNSNENDIKSVMADRKTLQRRLLKSTLTGILFFCLLIGGYYFISHDDSADETSAAARFFFGVNEKVGSTFQSTSTLSPNKKKPLPGTKPRINGDEGLQSPLELDNYKIEVTSGVQNFSLSPSEIQQLPPVEVSTDFKCIEGWSTVIHYKGLLFSDFMDRYHVGRKSDGSLYKYVALETPDGGYFVSLDMKSMLHPQTVLAYEMNGVKLSLQNGAPLRLIIPIKYGIKSLKRIGRIYFADERPQDFWTEQGYDWYSGL